jgi:putative ABC transport system permease protein
MPSIHAGPIFRSLLRNRARFVLIVLEVALTLAIVANSVSLILDARQEIARPSGFDDDHVVLIQSRPFARTLRDDKALETSAVSDLAVLRSVPGVEAATLTSFRPWAGGGSSTAVLEPGTKDRTVGTQFYVADSDFSRTLNVSLAGGRAFTEAEVRSKFERVPPAVMVTKALADRLYPKGDAVGQQLQFGDGEGSAPIVGVVGRFYNPYGGRVPDDMAYFEPGLPVSYNRGAIYLVRTQGPPERRIQAIEAALLKAENGRNVTLSTLTEERDGFHGRNRILVGSLNVVMGLLVLVTALGIIGITSFSVAERRRQIGTRRALGATKWEVVRHFLVENGLVTTIGIVLGVGLAFGLNAGLVTLIAGAKLAWPVLVGGALLLWTIGLASALGPALRAAQVAPALATRNV